MKPNTKKNARLNTEKNVRQSMKQSTSKNAKLNTKPFVNKLKRATVPQLLQLMVPHHQFQVMGIKLAKDMVLHKPLQKDMVLQLLLNVNNKRNKNVNKSQENLASKFQSNKLNKSARTYLSKLKSKNADKSRNKNAKMYQNRLPSKFQ